MADQDAEFDDYVEDLPEPRHNSQRLLITVLSVGCLALAISNVLLATRVTQLRRAAVAEPTATAPAPTDTAALPPSRSTEPAPVAPATAESRAATAKSQPSATSPSTESAAPTETAAAKPQPAPPAVEQRARPQGAERAKRPERPPTERQSRADSERQSGEPAASLASPTLPPRGSADVPASRVAPPTPAPAKPDPPRATTQEDARVAAVARATDRVTASDVRPERATATWMVQEYGRVDAERRARAVADFYGGNSPDGAYWRRVLGEIAATSR